MNPQRPRPSLLRQARLSLATAAWLALLAAPALAKERPELPDPAERKVLVCTAPGLSPEVEKAVAEFVNRAQSAPLIAAMQKVGIIENGILPQASGEVLVSNDTRLSRSREWMASYEYAMGNHLIVIGKPSQDPLLKKVWGHTVGLDEAKRELYSQGWGHMAGDIGWVECDRNPFLHSRNIEKAPYETLLIKISGTSDKGILAALAAFEKGLLSGFVPVGPITRSQTTLLDLDPLTEPPPVDLPESVDAQGGKAYYAGWVQIPETNYRACLEVGEVRPRHIWRVKYLEEKIMDQMPVIIRWQGGVNRRSFGNAINIMEFASSQQAQEVAELLATAERPHGAKEPDFKEVPMTAESRAVAWEAPEAADETTTTPQHWKVRISIADRFVVLSTLPPKATDEIVVRLDSQARKTAK